MSILTFVQADGSYTAPTGYEIISTGATTLSVVSNRLTAPNDGARKVLRETALPPGTVWTATINLGFAQNSNPGMNIGVGFFDADGDGYATRLFSDLIHLHTMTAFNGVSSLDTDSTAPGADQDLTLEWDTATGDLDVYLDATLVCSSNHTTYDETSGLRPGAYLYKFDGGVQAINSFKTSIADDILVEYTGSGGIELSGAATVEFVDSVLVSYTGDGGFTLSGAATIEFVDVTNVLVSYTGAGGITLSGVATIEFIDAGALVDYIGSGGFVLTGSALISSTVFYTGSGGFILAGAAQIQNVPANPYSANDRWTTNTPLATNFLYFRLLHQKNPLASRDKIEYIEGVEPEDSWEYPVNCVYDSTTGEVSIYSEVSEAEVLFTTLGITKLDITFDVNGRPVVVYELADEIWLYAYDTVFAEYSQFKIADGTSPFVCWDERRAEYVTTGDILVIYKRDNSVFMRRSRDEYLIEYATSLMNLANPFEIEGFGMTTTYRMQIRIRSTRTLEN